MTDDQPTLFDCIESDPAIACTDTFYDLACLGMDPARLGKAGLANLVLNRNLNRTADYEGLALLPLFQSCRAAARAKIMAIPGPAEDGQVAAARVAADVLAKLA